MKSILAVIAMGIVLATGSIDAEARGRSWSGGTKSFMTYKKPGPRGKVYVGRTSGKGPEQKILARRDSSHHMNKAGYGPAEIDKTSPNKDAIRGREQAQIDKYRQAGKSGNAINGISPKNPKRNHYLSESEKEFGKP